MSDSRYPMSFRFGERALKDLEIVTRHHSDKTGVPYTRTDILRMLLRRESLKISQNRQQNNDGVLTG